MNKPAKVNPSRVGGTLAGLRVELMERADFRLGWKLYDMAAEIGRLVAAMRKSAGLTQTQLAQRLNVGQPLIARLESDHPDRMPTFATIARVATECGYDMEITFHHRGHQKGMAPFVLRTSDVLR